MFKAVKHMAFVQFAIRAYNNWQQGILFCAGGIGDQPSWYLDMIDQVSSSYHDEKERREANRPTQTPKQQYHK